MHLGYVADITAHLLYREILAPMLLLTTQGIAKGVEKKGTRKALLVTVLHKYKYMHNSMHT